MFSSAFVIQLAGLLKNIWTNFNEMRSRDFFHSAVTLAEVRTFRAAFSFHLQQKINNHNIFPPREPLHITLVNRQIKLMIECGSFAKK